MESSINAAGSVTAVLRRFNRTYTQRIGVLDDSFLGLGRPLAASRLLFEVAASDPTPVDVRGLRERLGLDSGYLSRLLASLDQEGLVTTSPDPEDRRRRSLTLSDRGREAVAELDRRSEQLASRLVAPLTERQRQRLTEALATADLLVRAATVSLEPRRHDDPQVQEAVGRYVAELDTRFPGGFDAGPPEARIDPGGHYLLATSDGQPVAVGGVRALPLPGRPTAAEIKRMWVDPSWRGAGLGVRVLRALEELALGLGHDRVVLDTNLTLSEAVAMYERSGYVRVERYNDNSYAQAFFEKQLSTQEP